VMRICPRKKNRELRAVRGLGHWSARGSPYRSWGITLVTHVIRARRVSMHARVSTYELAPDKIDQAISTFRDAMGELDAMQEAVVLVDRSTGRAMTITYWENEQAAIDSREAADRVRSGATESASGSITSVEEFEVARKE
jgi:heme-degrading monooxygenase HmoA